jgi:type I restriction enzyme S subunit
VTYPVGPLGDLAAIEMGQSPASVDVNHGGSGVPLLNGPTEFGHQYPTPAQWTESGVRFAHAGDVLFCVRGSTTGRMNMADVTYAIGRGVAGLRARDIADSRIVKYALHATMPELLAGVSGSVFPNLSRDQILRHRVALPPPAEQQAIVEVLGVLDDKIAANAALAKTVDELVQTEFDALAPKSQRSSKTFSDIAQISGGGTPSTSDLSYWDGDIRWATPTDMTALAGPYLDATSRTISEAGLAACSSKLFSPGAILMTSRATIGALAVNTTATAVNQGFVVVEPNDDRLLWWLFHQMRARADEFLSWANGATFLELSRGNFKRLPVWTLADEHLAWFADMAGPLHGRARVALEENRTLAAARDTLLPELMSGRVRVHDAQKVLSDAGA